VSYKEIETKDCLIRQSALIQNPGPGTDKKSMIRFW